VNLHVQLNQHQCSTHGRVPMLLLFISSLFFWRSKGDIVVSAHKVKGKFVLLELNCLVILSPFCNEMNVLIPCSKCALPPSTVLDLATFRVTPFGLVAYVGAVIHFQVWRDWPFVILDLMWENGKPLCTAVLKNTKSKGFTNTSNCWQPFAIFSVS
jgi:hypothetical protein